MSWHSCIANRSTNTTQGYRISDTGKVESIMTNGEETPQVVFRASKKRKFYRQRDADTTPATEQTDSAAVETEPVKEEPKPEFTDEKLTIDELVSGIAHRAQLDAARATRSPDNEDDEPSLSVAEALRRRTARKNKLRGVEFRAESDGPADGEIKREGSAQRDLQGSREAGVGPAQATAPLRSSSFVPHTGIVGELVNKHM